MTVGSHEQALSGNRLLRVEISRRGIHTGYIYAVAGVRAKSCGSTQRSHAAYLGAQTLIPHLAPNPTHTVNAVTDVVKTPSPLRAAALNGPG